MKKDGGSAFPVPDRPNNQEEISYRDLAALMAMQGLVNQITASDYDVILIAQQAYEIADAMIAERDKE